MILTQTEYSVHSLALVARGFGPESCIVCGSFREKPCYWSRSNGRVMLPIGVYSSGFASGASSDGKVLVGALFNPDVVSVCIWKQGKIQLIATFHGHRSRNIHPAISGDGRTVIGALGAGDTWQAFKWSETHGIKMLKQLKSAERYSVPYCCDTSGRFVYGSVGTEEPAHHDGFWYSGPPLPPSERRACLWVDSQDPVLLPWGNLRGFLSDVSCDSKGKVAVVHYFDGSVVSIRDRSAAGFCKYKVVRGQAAPTFVSPDSSAVAGYDLSDETTETIKLWRVKNAHLLTSRGFSFSRSLWDSAQFLLGVSDRGRVIALGSFDGGLTDESFILVRRRAH